MKKRYKTRAGNEVNIWTFDSHQASYPVRGEVHAPDGSWRPEGWTASFAYTNSEDPSPNDLVEVHPCAELRPGDAVAVTDDLEDGPVVLSYVGYKLDGTVCTENICSGAIHCWKHGEPT